MKTRPFPAIAIAIALSGVAFGACVPVNGERILGRDLALADPLFSALPATLTIGYAPAPGARRTFATAELARIAHANGIAILNPAEMCFELAMRRLTEEEAVKAMRRSLSPGVELTVIELPKIDLPIGDLNFPITGLEPPAATQQGIQLWHGYIQYASTRRIQLWARVDVKQSLNAVVAAKDLAPNVPIDSTALRLEARLGPVLREQVALRIEDVLGRVPKRSVRMGSFIPLNILIDAPAVRRGDAVKVEVRSGPARLLFSAVAEKEARDGDLVELRNPSTGRTFRARMDGSRAVVIVPGAEPL